MAKVARTKSVANTTKKPRMPAVGIPHPAPDPWKRPIRKLTPWERRIAHFVPGGARTVEGLHDVAELAERRPYTALGPFVAGLCTELATLLWDLATEQDKAKAKP